MSELSNYKALKISIAMLQTGDSAEAVIARAAKFAAFISAGEPKKRGPARKYTKRG